MNIEQALKALAEEDAAREAPAHVEARLLEAYRSKRPRAVWRRALPWAFAAAAAAVLLLVVVRPKSPVLVVETTVGRAPSPAADALVGPVVEPQMPASEPGADQRVRPTSAVPVETATEFFPLLEIAPPFERGELVRVTLPAAAMRRVGIPVRQDMLLQPVQADILFGQEGLARAIRFVRFEQ